MFKEKCPGQEKPCSTLTSKKINDKGRDMFLRFGINLKLKFIIWNYKLSEILPRIWGFVVSWCFWKKKEKNNSLKKNGFCQSYYLTTPAWDAMLNMAKIDRELIPDPDMCFFLWKWYHNWVIFLFLTKKPTLSIWILTIQNKNQTKFYT